MDLTISLPKLEYGEHQELRGEYKYADDLINPKNWKDEISDFEGRINMYIDQRDEFANIRSKELRQIGLPSGETRKTMDVFQTLSGNIVNHSIFREIGKTIENQYEHFIVVPGRTAPSVPQTSIIDVDKLPKDISDQLVELSSVGSSLSNGLSILTSTQGITFTEQYINDNDSGANIQAAENPNLSKYNLYPEIIGTDIANTTSGSTDLTSVAFTAGGLFDWKFITPQQRTVGSAGDFGSIIIDIMFKIMEKQKKTPTNITNKPEENTIYIFNEIKKYYDPLITSNLFKDLEKLNEDVGPNPIISPATDRNPLVLGIKGDVLREPDIYALWCVWRSIRTPFYNRDSVKDVGKTSLNINDFFSYEINDNGGQIEFKNHPLKYDENSVKTIKERIIKELEGEKDSKSVLSVNISDLVTEYNVPITEKTSLANESISETIDKLNKLGYQAWFNIISQAFTSLYLSLFIAADTDWNQQVMYAGIEGLNVPMDRLSYNVNGIPTNFNNRLNLIKKARSEYNKYRNTLKTYLGINKNNTMGGTSLMGPNPFSIQRFGTVISYPGDSSVLENISGYLTMFLSDINATENRLQQSLDNMSNMYWYRDVLRWLEVLFGIFKPNDAPSGRSYSGAEVKARFFQLEKILKILYTKQIILMTDYIQKIKILQKRYIGSGRIDKSLEKQIKITSYYTHSTICYIKRQILIVYHLLDKTLESWWTSSPTATLRKRRPVSPAFNESDFNPAYRIMKSSLVEWFRGEVSRLTSSFTDPEIVKEIRTLGRDLCDSDKSERLKSKTVSNVHLQDEKVSGVITDARFWLLLMANIKNKDITSIGLKPEELLRLYIPVYTKESSGKFKYYLFDIMPLVLKGNYTSQFGRKNAPQWLTAIDVEKTKFTKKNSGIVILSNTPGEISYHGNWKAISSEWFDKVIEKASESASNSGNPEQKLFIIRNAMYILLKDPAIYNSKVLNKKILGSNDIDVTKSGFSKMRVLLETYQDFTNSVKEETSSYLMLVSREFVKNEMISASVQFHTI